MALRKANEFGAQYVLHKRVTSLIDGVIEEKRPNSKRTNVRYEELFLVTHEFFSMGLDGSLLVNAPHLSLRFGAGGDVTQATEGEYYYTREELALTKKKDPESILKAANDEEYLRAVATLARYRASSNDVKVVAATPLQIRFLEDVVGRFHSWYLDHNVSPPSSETRHKKVQKRKTEMSKIYAAAKPIYAQHVMHFQKQNGTDYGAYVFADDETRKWIKKEYGEDVSCKKIRAAMRNS